MPLFRYAIAMILLFSIASCATPPKEVPEPEPSYALEPEKDGAFANVEAAFVEKHGTRKSGFCCWTTMPSLFFSG